MTEPSFTRSLAAQARLHELVPGGAHTYARGSDQYPEEMTPVLTRGAGARVVDLDGNEYVEYGMGLRAVTLGHAHPAVNQAVTAALADGVNFTRPTALELEAAETFLSHVPGADMVKFAKNGSDVTTAAVKLARAATGRSMVATCRSQPFFSVDDWFIGSTPMNAGIPDGIRADTVGFDYNDLASLHAVLDEHDGDVACVLMEAASAVCEPEPGFLEAVRDLTRARGIVLVFDEIVTGMRWAAGGGQEVYGVVPDLSCWGKGLGNGYAISALAGRRELMELGGLRTDRSRPFLVSTTFGPESVGLAASIAVAGVYRSEDVVGTMERQGERLRLGVAEVVGAEGLSDAVEVIGRPSCLVFLTRDSEGVPSQSFRTLFLQELLARGVLGQSFVISAAHTDVDVDHTIAAVEAALPVYAKAIAQGSVDGLLRGRPVAPALRAHAHPRAL